MAADLVDVLRSTDTGLSSNSIDLMADRVVIEFSREPDDTHLDLYMRREGDGWKIFTYSFGAGFGSLESQNRGPSG